MLSLLAQSIASRSFVSSRFDGRQMYLRCDRRHLRAQSYIIFQINNNQEAASTTINSRKLRPSCHSGYSLVPAPLVIPSNIVRLCYRVLTFLLLLGFHLAKPGTKSPISSASNTLFSSVRGPYSLSVVVRYSYLLILALIGVFRPKKLHLLLDRSGVDGTAVSS